MARLSLAAVASEVEAIKEKVLSMEQLAKDEAIKLNNRLSALETTGQEILSVVTSAKTVSRFARRWAAPVISAAVTAGLFNPKVAAFLDALVG